MFDDKSSVRTKEVLNFASLKYSVIKPLFILLIVFKNYLFKLKKDYERCVGHK